MNKSNNNLSEKVKKTLQGHQIWIESHGKKGKIADLSGLDLRFIDLRKSNLWKANLNNSNLKLTFRTSKNKFSQFISFDLKAPK